MRALSLWRPWPWSFIHADKRIENRDWEIKYRGDVVWQAAKKFDADAVPFIHQVARAGGFPWEQCSGIATQHPAGVLAFVATVVDCLPIEEVEQLAKRGIISAYLEGEQRADRVVNIAAYPSSMIDWKRQAQWAFGPWCTVLANVRPITKSIPWKGSQGWFDVPDAIVAEALAA